jgi:hypothetical protein
MPQVVVNGAILQCSFGIAPSTLVITPENRANITSLPIATIMDNIPMKNIMPFGMCQSLANPQVAAATAAASGVLTPQPCIPVINAPWTPGSVRVLLNNNPILTSSSTCMCNWGGVITLTNSGQIKVNAP